MTSFGAAVGMRGDLDGAMRFDPGRDLGAVVALLLEGFKGELEAHDRRWLAELTAMSGGARALGFLMRIVPAASDSFSGFVRYADGRLVGNVTLLRQPGETWVIANVVTAPDLRRRGIGRELVRLAIDEAARRGARRVVLQVRRENAMAIALYADLGFVRHGATHTLNIRAVRLASGRGHGLVPGSSSRAAVWRRADDPAVRRLLARSGGLDAPGPVGLVRGELNRRGLRHRLDDWLKMRRSLRVLVAGGAEVRAAAVAHITERDVPHRVEFVLDPVRGDDVAGAVVGAILDRLRDAPERPIDALVDADQSDLEQRLVEVGFSRSRTLERMVLDRGRRAASG